MKTNLMQCVMAYQAVTGMMNTACDYKTAYALVMLKRRLDPHVQFFIRREQELVDEYAARDGKGGVVWDTPTSFRFADTARAAEYAEKRAELGRTLPKKKGWESSHPVCSIYRDCPPWREKPPRLESMQRLRSDIFSSLAFLKFDIMSSKLEGSFFRLACHS